MNDAKKLFDQEIIRARDMVGVALAMRKLTPTIFDVTDNFRFALVHAVSAFDKYIHDIVYYRMMEMAAGDKKKSNRFTLYQVSINAALSSGSLPPEKWLGPEVVEKHSYLSFQRADKVADAIRIINDAPLWPAIANKIGSDQKIIKDQLDVIIDRRNKIVHEADMDPVNRTRWPITDALTSSAIGTIGTIGDAIFDIVN